MIRYIFLAATVSIILLLIILITSLPTPNTLAVTKAQAPTDTQKHENKLNNVIFTNITIFDGVNVTSNQTLVVSQGKISSISASTDAIANTMQGYLSIDGSDLTLMPGIIDAHTHTFGNGLSDALRFGVTSHLDMFGTEETLSQTRIARDALSQSTKADLYSAGTLATVAGGHGTQFGFTIDTIESIEEIASWVALRKDAGADYIKLVYMPYQTYMPSLNREFAKEIIKQSHLQGMQVLAHISTHKGAQDLIEDGIDGLVHIFSDKLASDELIALAKQNGVFIIPTLAVTASADSQKIAQALVDNQNVDVYLSAQQRSSLASDYGTKIPGFEFDIAKQNVKRFFDAGIPILSGSDAPNPGTAYGISALHETILLVDAGLSPTQALAAATSEPARVFSLKGKGVIKQGARADIVLVSGNPVNDINALYKITAVFKNGFNIPREIDAQDLVGKPISNTVLGDFTISVANSDGLNSIDSFSWTLSDDSMANGKSKANIEVVNMPSADNASNHKNNNGVLKVTTSVNAGFPYPWAGAAVGDFIAPVEGKDISGFTTITFDVKGTAGVYRVMSFDTTATGIPPNQSFKINDNWQTITLPLAAFSGINMKMVSGFAFVAGPQQGEFTFYLDNIRIK